MLVDQRRKKLYYTEKKRGNPDCYSLKGVDLESGERGGIEELITNCDYLGPIELNRSGTALYYFVGAGVNAPLNLNQYHLKDRKSEVVVPYQLGMRDIFNVTIDHKGGSLFWTRKGDDRVLDGIWRLRLNGEYPPEHIVGNHSLTCAKNVIVKGKQVGYPYDITCQPFPGGRSRVYWTDMGTRRILSAWEDGSDCQLVFHQCMLPKEVKLKQIDLNFRPAGLSIFPKR